MKTKLNCQFLFHALFITLVFILSPSVNASLPLEVSMKTDTNSPYSAPDWEVDISFTRPVSKEKLQRYIRAVSGTIRIPVNIESISALLYKVSPEKPSSPGSMINVSIESGLNDSAGLFTLTERVKTSFSILPSVNVSSVYFKARDKGSAFNLCLALDGHIKPLEQNDSNRHSSRDGSVKVRPSFILIPSVYTWHSGATRPNRNTEIHQYRGSFPAGKSWTLKIPRHVASGAVINAAEFRITSPDYPKAVKFAEDQTLVELYGPQRFPINVMNLKEVACQMTELPPAAALFHLMEKSPTLIQTRNYLEAFNKAVEESSLSIEQKKKYLSGDIKTERLGFLTPSRSNEWTRVSIPLKLRARPDTSALLLLQAGCPTDTNVKTRSVMAQVTDAGITWKESETSISIWTTSLNTAQPLSSSDIILGMYDGSIMMPGRTDENGLLILKNGMKIPTFTYDTNPKDSAVSENTYIADKSLIIQDIQYILTSGKSGAAIINTEDEDLIIDHGRSSSVTFRKPGIQDKPTAVIVMDRGIFRPGENIEFKTFIRRLNNRHQEAVADETVEISLVNQANDTIFSKIYRTSEFGTCADNIDLSDDARPGTYSLRLKHNGKKLYTARPVVSPFRQPRHNVSVSGKMNGKFSEFTISGRYMSGGPLSGAQTSWKASLIPVQRSVPGKSNHIAGSIPGDPREVEAGETMLDSQGKAIIELPVDERLISGAYELSVDAFVVDFDGRSASGSTRLSIKPDHYLAIGPHSQRSIAGASISFPILITDSEGNTWTDAEGNNTQILCEILNRSWMWTTERDSSGKAVERWQDVWKRSSSRRIEIKDGKALFENSFDAGGEYRLAFTAIIAGEKLRSETSLTVDGAGMYREAGYRGGISLTLDKNRYNPGDKALVKVWATAHVPQLLLSVEGKDIYYTTTVPMKADPLGGCSGEAYFKISHIMSPNCWVTAVAPLPRRSFPTYRADDDISAPGALSGTARLEVTRKPTRLEITTSLKSVTSLEKKNTFKPGEKVEIEVQVDNGNMPAEAEVMISVVDEGVLWMTRYRLPDFHRALDSIVPLSVITGDLRGSLVLQVLDMLGILKPVTGGDGPSEGMNEEMHLRKNFSPTAIFIPALKTDSTGKVSAEFILPDALTSWRVSVAACDSDDGFGSRTSQITTTLPFSIEPGIPSFLTAGDHAEPIITGINRMSEDRDVQISIKHSAGLEISPSSIKENVPANNRTLMNFSLTAGEYPGDNNILFSSSLFDKNSSAKPSEMAADAVSIDLPVLSSILLADHVKSGINSGVFPINTYIPAYVEEYLKTEIPADRNAVLKELWMKSGKPSAQIHISTNPAAAAASAVKYLKNYPYGCVEQTSSRLAALSCYLREGLAKKDISGIDTESTKNRIEKDIASLLKMQTSTGLFGYWPGSSNASPTGTMYALWALYHASKAGYSINQEIFTAGAGYLAATGMGRIQSMEGQVEYVLALLEHPDLPVFNDLRLNNMSREGSAWAIAARTRLLKNTVLSENPDNPEAAEEINRLKSYLAQLLQRPSDPIRSYYSGPARETAALLTACKELSSHSQRSGELSRALIAMLKNGRWQSTAVTSWCLSALCFQDVQRIDRAQKQKTAPISIKFPDGTDKTLAGDIPSASFDLDWITIMNSGTIEISSPRKQLFWSITVPMPTSETLQSNKSNHTPENNEDSSNNESPPNIDVNTQTLKASGFKNGNKNGIISLERSITPLNGSNVIKVGDIVKINLQFEIRNKESYLLLDDPLPAGFVALNMDIPTTEEIVDNGSNYYSGGLHTFYPDYTEIHEDKVLAFRENIWNGNFRFSYYARAVCAGEFTLLPASGIPMYKPDSTVRTEKIRIRIDNK